MTGCRVSFVLRAIEPMLRRIEPMLRNLAFIEFTNFDAFTAKLFRHVFHEFQSVCPKQPHKITESRDEPFPKRHAAII